MAICSKNNLDNVLTVLNEHPDMVLRKSDFSTIVANYNDKATNIQAITKQLNIGLDSVLFLDDSAFERNLVRSALPDVHVPELPDDPAEYLSTLAYLNPFEAQSATEEDRERSNYYINDQARLVLRDQHVDYNSFLMDLDMKADILGLDDFTLPRVTQLIQRSNQFNLTTIRYSEEQLRAFCAEKQNVSFCIKLSDRLGDNGIVAVILLRSQASDMFIDSWIMSCRVLGRGMEEYTLNKILMYARQQNCDRIIGYYIPTPKNAMVATLYERLGFQAMESQNDTAISILNVDESIQTSTFIRDRQT